MMRLTVNLRTVPSAWNRGPGRLAVVYDLGRSAGDEAEFAAAAVSVAALLPRRDRMLLLLLLPP